MESYIKPYIHSSNFHLKSCRVYSKYSYNMNNINSIKNININNDINLINNLINEDKK